LRLVRERRLADLLDLPDPANVAASGRARLPWITCATAAPALSIRRAASSDRSSAAPAVGEPISRLTRTARGRSGFLRVLNRDRHGPRGTTVEIACLYTIWVTVFFSSTTVLIEGFDLTLKLDAVHEVDRDRHMLFCATC
jgi:hypothetical protein